ncbi:ABC transporter substrate-binding protein [Stackebrandtia soli]|uniref:ABC transporter substrate-binding protein n=1 Tax=Stackebrandtia soli TaxID=1892856 RepID=UPI0039EC74EE
MRTFSVRAVAATASAAIALTLTACTGADTPSEIHDTVRIGWQLPMSGPLESVGADMREAFTLYLKEHNGQLGNRTVELTVTDEGTSGKKAKESIARLIDKDVVAVAGVVSAAAFDTVAPALQEVGLPLIGTGERPHVGPGVPTGLWQVSWGSDEPGRAIAPYLASETGGSTFVIASNDLSGKAQADSFLTEFAEADGSLANSSGDAAYVGSNDLGQQLANAAASGASAVYAAFSAERAVDFVAQYMQSPAADIPLYGGFLTEEPLLDEQGTKARGLFSVSNYYSTIDNEANRDFVAAWARHYRGQPNAYALAAWDATLVLDRAIAQIPLDVEVTPELLNDAISRVGEVDSPRGPWRFSETSHSPVQRWYLRQVTKDGPALVNTVIADLATLGG